MSSDEKRYLDLGPFFPKKPIGTPPTRDDGAAVAGPAGVAEGDMSTGSSKGANNSKMQDITLPAVTYDDNGEPNRRV